VLKTKFLIKNALIAALYAALTLGLAPFSYGFLQVRISEFMTMLAFHNRNFIPGLVLGCFLSNIGSPFGLTDIIIGTLATFLAVTAMQFCPNAFLASLMPVLFNGVIVGWELAYLAALPPGMPVAVAMLYIGFGEFLSVSVLGLAIVKLLHKNTLVQGYLDKW